MTLFDLVFLFVVLATLITLVIVVASVLLGRPRLAAKVLALYGVCLVIYLGIIILVSLTTPKRVLDWGENRCFDDWCIAVDDIARSESAMKVAYRVTLRLSSRARRVAQRENGLVVYLEDEQGRRFESIPGPAEQPFNILLEPGQSVTTTRVFEVSSAASQHKLIVAHEGFNSFPGIIIIGDDNSLFHKPMIVRLP
jgi:hypothetical protein